MGCSFSRYHQVLAPLFRENSRRLGFPCLLWALHPLQPEAETKWFVESFEKLWKRNVCACICLAASPALFLCPFLEQKLRGTFCSSYWNPSSQRLVFFFCPVQEPVRLEAFGDLEWKQPRLASIQWFFLRSSGSSWKVLSPSFSTSPKEGSQNVVRPYLSSSDSKHSAHSTIIFCKPLAQDNTHFALQVSWASAAKHLPLLSAWKVCNLACLVLLLWSNFRFASTKVASLSSSSLRRFCCSSAFFLFVVALAQTLLRHSSALCPSRISCRSFSRPLVESAYTS